ncbi:MAG: hypothetical protein FWG68_05390 [Defluviitaleaceae bacterium]|nr:hypothetical protein [Defluviitaleaceae bacterium]
MRLIFILDEVGFGFDEQNSSCLAAQFVLYSNNLKIDQCRRKRATEDGCPSPINPFKLMTVG